MAAERQLRKISVKHALLLIVPSILAAALFLFLPPSFPKAIGAASFCFLILYPILVGAWFTLRRRCPECFTTLRFRQEFIGGTTRYRCLYDCPRCNTTWDAGERGDSGP